jgi:hypothetical protein
MYLAMSVFMWFGFAAAAMPAAMVINNIVLTLTALFYGKSKQVCYDRMTVYV